MAWKLSKQERSDGESWVATLNEAHAKLEDAIREHNEAMEKAAAGVHAAVDAYNEALAGARQYRDDTANRIEGDYDDKSEKWQEGEKGQEVQEWFEEWREVDLEDISIDMPSAIDETAIDDHAEALDNLRTEL